MLCRALLAAVVLSYVLCVLLLSGVQKEDLDEGTLRKLQRHNINIDDINDQSLQERCLGTTNAPITLATVTLETPTEKTILSKKMPETDKSVGLLSADTTPLEKIVEYLENKYKDQKIKSFDSKDNMSKFGLTAITTLPPSTSTHDRYQELETENVSTVAALNKKEKSAVAFNKYEKTNEEIEKIMKVWQTNIDRISDTTQQESTTINIIKAEPVSKNTKDVEYISKIVAEIMSKRKLDEVKTSTVRAQQDLNENFRDADQSSTVQFKNETGLPTNYYLNNCNLGNFYASKQEEKEKDDTFNNLNNPVAYSDDMPDTSTKTNNNKIICKRIEDIKDNIPLQPDSVNENAISHIIEKLKKAGQSFNGHDNGNAKAFGTSLENHLKSLPFTRQHINNIYKERLSILDNESVKALETVLENQSKHIFFGRQNSPLNTNNTYRERLSLFETTTDRPKSIFYYPAIQTTNVKKEKQNNYARFVEENKRVWERYFASMATEEPKLKYEHTQTIIKTPNFHYKMTKQGHQTEDEEYKRWLYTFHKPLNKQEATMENKQNSLINSRLPPPDHEKPTDLPNGIQQASNLGYQYRRPWLYGEQSSEQFKARIKGKQETILFKPKKHEKIMNMNDPSLENTYRQKIPPYFIPLDKNMSIISIQEREMSENNQEALLDSPRIQPLNSWEKSREIFEADKKPANFVGWYRNKTPFMTEDRSSKQLESNRDEISHGRSQANHHNKIMPLPNAEYKSHWGYLRNKQSNNQNTNEDHEEETEYFINSKSSKQFTYQYPPRPYKITTKIPLSNVDASNNQFTDPKEKLSNENEKKLPTFPANVIKDIANSIKEIVLRDLKTTTLTKETPTTITPTTTTTTETTTTSTTTTTTRTTTTQSTTLTTTTPPTTTTTPTTTMSTTTGSLDTTAKEDPLRVQDASKAMEQLMEMFQKISSMKDKAAKLDNVKNTQSVRYHTKATATKNVIFPTQEQLLQFKPENRVPYALHQTEMKVENRIRYDHHPAQPIDDAPTEQNQPENIITYTQPLIQRAPENLPRMGINTPYYQSKIEYNPYIEKDILLSVTQKAKVKKVAPAITVQTNSGEIAPLKIELHKPMIQNVVLTTKPPTPDPSSDEIANYRKPMTRHKVNNMRQDEVGNNREHKAYVSRHTHRDTHVEAPKSRKIKNQHFTEQYKTRGIQVIDGFHDKLERGEDWNPYKEAIPKRMQRPLSKKANYDDTHFRNFLHTQEKVNAMLEQILGHAKSVPASAEIITSA